MKAFTLIELLVSITISMLLMTSIGIFMSNGLGVINKQTKIIENSASLANFFFSLQNTLDLGATGSGYIMTGLAAFFPQKQYFQDGGFGYIGQTTLSGSYCSPDSESPETNHIYTTSFIPFEEQGENIISSPEDIYTSQIVTFQGENYQTEQFLHRVVTSTGDIRVGKGVFGNTLRTGQIGSDSFLNHPTGLATDNNVLFIADTLNHRVLYMDTSGNIYPLLTRKDGLDQPTGLYYNDTQKALYISNSGAGEILKYSSFVLPTPTSVTYNYSGSTLNNISHFRVDLHYNGSGHNIDTFPSLGDVSFDSITKNSDLLAGENDSFGYYFVNSFNSSSNQSDCSGPGDMVNLSGVPIRCLSTGTGQTANILSQDIANGSNIYIDNIQTNIGGTGSYSLAIEFFDNLSSVYKTYIPYFEQSDNSLLTPSDNTLEVIETDLQYPTGIWGNTAGDRNEFLETGRDFSGLQLEYKPRNDTLLASPISQLSFQENNDIFTINLEYYKSYNCYNLDDKTSRTIFFQKNIK